MLNIISYQGDTNQNRSELLMHIDRIAKNITHIKCWSRYKIHGMVGNIDGYNCFHGHMTDI